MRLLITILLLFNVAYGQTKETTTVGGWNAFVYNPQKPARLLIFFHGAGEAGTNVSKLFANGLPQLIQTLGFTPLKNIYIVCPQAPYGAFPADKIPELLTAIKAKYPMADIANFYVTGLSFGGQSAMEAVIYKPLHVMPMSAAGGGNTLVNFIADNKIPITHWTGGNEPDNIGWTLYQVNQKVTGLTKTVIRPGIGHCCWNDIYKSSAFWDLIDEGNYTPPPITKKDTTVNNLNPFVLPPGTWTVKTTTARAGTYAIQAGKLVTMSEGVFVLDGDFEYTITFKKPPAVEPVQCMVITIDNKKTVLYSHPEKNFYKGVAYDMTIECDGKKLTLKKDFTWQIK